MADMQIKKTRPKRGAKATMAAVLCMAVGLSITANAAGSDLNNEKNSGKTTVRVGVTKSIPEPISFEVPLYYTAAIVAKTPDNNDDRKNTVMYPDGYYIKNLYNDSDINNTEEEQAGKGSGRELVVANIQVSSVKGATWDLVDSLSEDDQKASDVKKMSVSLGGVPLPAITKGDEAFSNADLKSQNSIFYNLKDGYLVIGDHDGDGIHDGDGRTDIDLKIDIPKEYVPEKGPTIAQFRVVYTLTTKNADGSLVGYWDQGWVDRDYVGPSKATAETSSQEKGD